MKKDYPDIVELNGDRMLWSVKEYVRTHPEMITELVSIAMESQKENIQKLENSKHKLENNHLFLYDIMTRTPKTIYQELFTSYTKIDKGSFNDDPILKILRGEK